MAEEVSVNPEKMRKFIGYLLGFADVARDIPEFLEGKHGGTSVWLREHDLGNIPEFHKSWTDICSWREQEARELEKVLRGTAQRLFQGLAAFTKEDEEVATLFPKGDDYDFVQELKDKGFKVDGKPSRLSAYGPLTGSV